MGGHGDELELGPYDIIIAIIIIYIIIIYIANKLGAFETDSCKKKDIYISIIHYQKMAYSSPVVSTGHVLVLY